MVDVSMFDIQFHWGQVLNLAPPFKRGPINARTKKFEVHYDFYLDAKEQAK